MFYTDVCIVGVISLVSRFVIVVVVVVTCGVSTNAIYI